MSDQLSMMSAAEELISHAPSRGVVIAICLAVFLVAGSIAGAALYHIDVYATAPGRVQPVGRSKSIQAIEQARIIASYVREGSHVRRGQILAALDPASSAFDEGAARLEELSLSAEIARRTTEERIGTHNVVYAPRIPFLPEIPQVDRDREQLVLGDDLRQLRSEAEVAEARIAGDRTRADILESTLSEKRVSLITLENRLANRRQLKLEGWKSGTEVDDTVVDVQKLRADILATQQDIAEARSDASEQTAQLTASRAKFFKANADQLEQAQNKLGQIHQQFLKEQSRTNGSVVRAPVDGTVQALSITNPGQVATAGETLMTVVPDAPTIQVEALVSDRDMGFVRVGQEVVIKVRAYPFTRYGVVRGIVSKIARDSIDSREAAQNTDSNGSQRSVDDPSAMPLPHVQDLVYPVIVDIIGDRTIDVDGVKTPIRPGMAVEVEIKTATRTVLEYVLSPIGQALSDAGHER
ncbi:HlyD family type I secretion periplasmic adaptor subunit [Sphingobium sp. Sx8-8]|uniref:HlyD family type I secretion periplasmic adaptor subunit n=1 Tax=Sphingobium sp. Sx8-8 TaxID=2933617 RepID=UPI001F58834A|nr:HlyD family type I secretion periplasmic adaptor subunit [Sphingobium sp. Sx8-8]